RATRGLREGTVSQQVSTELELGSGGPKSGVRGPKSAVEFEFEFEFDWNTMTRLLLLTCFGALLAVGASAGREGRMVRFKKTVVDREFRSEGVAVADVNRDGRPDII